MNRKELVDMVEIGSSIVRSFIADGDDPSYPISSYENWNSGEVVGHIVGWMNYSIDKLSCIKLGTKQSDEYTGISSLDDINKILYNKAKSKSKEEIETDYLSSLGGYIKIISLFTDSELGLTTFDTGFKMELWRYMIMDTVIHPVQHILYQHIKRGEYGRVVEAIMASEGVFEKYAAGRKAYALQEFAVDRPEYQSKLDEIGNKYGAIGSIREFVQMNRND